MDFLVINDEQIEKLYPNNYDEEILRKYSLMDRKPNIAFKYYYSYYRYILDLYLNSVLDLNSIDDEIEKQNCGLLIRNTYNEISKLGLNYVYIRNNIFLDRFSEEEFANFKEYYSNKNTKKIFELVKNTYKKLIVFDINLSSDTVINYDPINGDGIAFNNSLVIGVNAKESKELRTFLNGKEADYTKILNMPVKIFIYDSSEDRYVKKIENLNALEDEKNKTILASFPKYLPLGSVVILKKGIKKLMIMGYSQVDMDNKDKIYDYIGCLYPEGVIASNQNILFNHDDIKSIIAIGLKDPEQKDFMDNIELLIGNDEHLNSILKSIQENN